MEFIILLSLTTTLTTISFIKDKQKTKKTLKIAMNKMKKIIGPILLMVLFISITLFIIPEESITEVLSGKNKISGIVAASLAGSILMVPGFIAFPLGGILRQNGVPFMVIAAFTSTLMMVGLVTLPIEKQYLGIKIALLRNIIYLFIALIVALATGLFYGEFNL